MIKEDQTSRITRLSNSIVHALGNGTESPFDVTLAMAVALKRISVLHDERSIRNGADTSETIIELFNDAYNSIKSVRKDER